MHRRTEVTRQSTPPKSEKTGEYRESQSTSLNLDQKPLVMLTGGNTYMVILTNCGEQSMNQQENMRPMEAVILGGPTHAQLFTSRDHIDCHVEESKKIPLWLQQKEGKKIITVVKYTNNSSLLSMVKSFQSLKLPR